MKVVGLYTEKHLYELYQWSLENNAEDFIDTAGKDWKRKDIKEILVKEYGYVPVNAA